MIEKGIYFVRIDSPKNTENLTDKDFQDHVEYLSKISENDLFAGGGFNGSSGGMIVFKAENIESAEIIAMNDPIIKRGFFDYVLREWDVILTSKEK